MGNSIKFSLYPLLTVLLYFFCIIRLSYISNINNYSLVVCILIFLYLLFKGAITNNKKYKNINISLFVFCFFIFLSSLVNMDNLDGSILYILTIINITLFVQCEAEKKKLINVSKILFILSTITTIITIWYEVSHPFSAWKHDMNYLIGTKFFVSYNAISSILFYKYAYNGQKKRIFHNIILVGLIVLSFYTCRFVECATGIIGTFFVVIFLIIMKKRKTNSDKINILMKAYTPIIVLIISAVGVVLLDKLISIPIISHIISDVFEKNSDLSGRLIVYASIPGYLKGNILFGYGYNNIYKLFNGKLLIRSNLYACDAQNALLEYLLYFGIFGCITFFVFVKNCFQKLNTLKLKDLNNNVYFVIGFYLLVFLGTIEITISPLFYLFLAFLSCGEFNVQSSKRID